MVMYNYCIIICFFTCNTIMIRYDILIAKISICIIALQNNKLCRTMQKQILLSFKTFSLPAIENVKGIFLQKSSRNIPIKKK